MKYPHFFISVLLIGSLLLVNSCCSARKLDDTTIENENSSSEGNTQTDVLEQKTLTGSFRSVRGVMDPLSCYCSNGGYITQDDGTVIAVSFSDDADVTSSDKITVTGYRTSRSIEANGTCPAGMMGFLKVDSYIIGETDY